jgi:hypothetical protein
MGFLDRFWPRRRTRDSVAAQLQAWRIVTATNDDSGQAAIFRIRMSKPSREDVDSLRTAVVVKWPYDASAVKPPDAVNQQQRKFEQALDPLSSDDNSELLQVTTGMGVKQWVYYARSRDVFMSRFNKRLKGHPAYPVKIEFYDDPQWKVWGDTVENLRQNGA